MQLKLGKQYAVHFGASTMVWREMGEAASLRDGGRMALNILGCIILNFGINGNAVRLMDLGKSHLC